MALKAYCQSKGELKGPWLGAAVSSRKRKWAHSVSVDEKEMWHSQQPVTAFLILARQKLWCFDNDNSFADGNTPDVWAQCHTIPLMGVVFAGTGRVWSGLTYGRLNPWSMENPN